MSRSILSGTGVRARVLVPVLAALWCGTAQAAALQPSPLFQDDKERHDHDEEDGHDHDHGDQDKEKQRQIEKERRQREEEGEKPLERDLLKPGPRLQWEFGKNSHDFGSVTQGAIMVHNFELSSAGTEPVTIKQIKPTCGCTTGDVMVVQADGTRTRYNFGEPLSVGTKVLLEARLNTKNKSGHTSSSINIFSDDVRGPVQLGLEADVAPFFHVNPKHINIGEMSVKDIRTEKVTIGTFKGEKVLFTMDLGKLPQGVHVDLLPLAPDEAGKSSTWEAIVTMGPNMMEGNLAQPVLLKSDVPIEGAEPNADGTLPVQDVNFTLTGRVLGVVSYTPAYVSMGLVRPGQVVPRSVRLTSHDAGFTFSPETRVEIVGVKDVTGAYQPWEHADKFTPIVRPVEGQSAIDVELRLDGLPESVQGSFRGTMLVHIAHPAKPTVEIPITGVCRGGVTEK